MPPFEHTVQFRVRYYETDQMRTYYNSRALEWFEFGRTELLRAMGSTYRQWEDQGVQLPLTEAHLNFLGPAQYDDLLAMTTTASRQGRARLRFEVEIRQAESGRPVCSGWTVHAITNKAGRPIRPPEWLWPLLARLDDPT
jgi:acyl-CoA thioester hydrolase